LSHTLDRLHDEGGYMAVRLSGNTGSWLHALHVSADGEISNYRPAAPLRHPLVALTGFEGEASSGDDVALAKPVPLRAIWISALVLALGATAWAVGRWARAALRRV
jgi:hypothetical protein